MNLLKKSVVGAVMLLAAIVLVACEPLGGKPAATTSEVGTPKKKIATIDNADVGNADVDNADVDNGDDYFPKKMWGKWYNVNLDDTYWEIESQVAIFYRNGEEEVRLDQRGMLFGDFPIYKKDVIDPKTEKLYKHVDNNLFDGNDINEPSLFGPVKVENQYEILSVNGKDTNYVNYMYSYDKISDDSDSNDYDAYDFGAHTLFITLNHPNDLYYVSPSKVGADHNGNTVLIRTAFYTFKKE